MENQFGLVPPWRAGRDQETYPVQVVVLVQSPGTLAQAALRETLDAVAAAPVAAGCWRWTGQAGTGCPPGSS